MKQRQATVLMGLPPNRVHALELLAAGARTSDVASTLGVHRATVWKWTQEPEFQEASRSIRGEALAILSEGLRNQAARAVFVLGELMDDPDPRTRRDAARIVLGSYTRLRPVELPVSAPEPEPEMTEEEFEERVLELWGHIQEDEVRRPGFLASNPQLARVELWALEIQARRGGGRDTP